jgi:hypothetical protein
MNKLNAITHYYGDTVRRFFVTGALFMVATLPFVAEYIALPFTLSLVGILIVSVAAGITSPQFVWSAILNIFISLYAVLQFEWYAVHWYWEYGAGNSFFWINQILAVIFLLALYFAVKTFRGVRTQFIDEKISATHRV